MEFRNKMCYETQFRSSSFNYRHKESPQNSNQNVDGRNRISEKIIQGRKVRNKYIYIIIKNLNIFQEWEYKNFIETKTFIWIYRA